MGAGPIEVLSRDFTADAALADLVAFTIGKAGSTEDSLAVASAATDKAIGVIQQTAKNKQTVRAMLIGISKVIYGGTVAYGDMLVSDANGHAVVATRHTHTENTAATYTQNATTGPGSGERTIGTAMAAGVVGDVGRVMLSPSFA